MNHLDLILGSVNVFILETGQTITYCNMSRRDALLHAFFQYTLNTYNTWDYCNLSKKHGWRVRESESGKTAAIHSTQTYCVLLN